MKTETTKLPVTPTKEKCGKCPLLGLPHVTCYGVPARRLDSQSSLTKEQAIGVKYLLVGEAPGENENQTGLPFVGASGQLLNTALQNLGSKIDLATIAVTNSVRCQPEGNKNPGVKIKRSCLQYLEEEISLLPDLEVVIVMGTQALTTLAPAAEGGIGANRLKVMDFNGLPMVGTYHPAAILYDRAKAPAFQDDLHAYLVRDTWKDTEVKYFPSEQLVTSKEVKGFLDRAAKARRIGVDIETRSFTDDIISLGMYIEEE